MITIVPDIDGKVVAYIEWRQVAKSGFDKLGGEYIWVNDLWVHEDYRNQGLIQQMIDRILCIAPEAEFCYFTRRKYNNRMSKLWKRKNFEMLVKKMEMV